MHTIQTVHSLPPGLKSISIPKSVTYIGPSAFNNCRGLTSVKLPDDITSIEDWTFRYCSNLSEVFIPSSVREIKEGAYYGAKIDTIFIPKTVIQIGKYAFCCTADHIVVDQDNPFYDSRNNCEAIIETASDLLIASCKHTTIPEGVKGLGPYSCSYNFYYSGVSTLSFPESLTFIGANNYLYCPNITSIILPAHIKSIGEGTFCGLNNLKDVFCFCPQVPQTGMNVFYDSNMGNVTLHVPAQSVNEYMNEEPWKRFKIIALNDDDEVDLGEVKSDDPSTILLYYNLSGQRLSKPQRGVNIINGKKVIVR